MAPLLALVSMGCERAEERPGPPVQPVAHEIVPLPACEPGHWGRPGDRCVPVEEAFLGEGGRTHWVAPSAGRSVHGPDGTEAHPWPTINDALRRARPGDAVVIRAGTYYEVLEPRLGGTGAEARITLSAYPGEEVIVSGKEYLGGGRQEGRTLVFPWPGEPLPLYGSEADPVFRRELIGIGDGARTRLLEARPTGSPLGPGTFRIDGSPDRPRRIVVRLPDGAGAPSVWLARPAQLFVPRGPDRYVPCGDPSTPGWFRLVGLTFEVAANYAQEGAVCAGSAGSLFEQVTVRWTNARGLDASGRGHTFRDVRALDHGQLGIGGACTRCVFEGGEVRGNNWKGYDPLWEAGGIKLLRTSETVLRHLLVRDNDGPGIWLDTDNHANTIEGCRVERNAVAGIMLEYATTGTLVQHNRIRGTRFSGYSGAGILSQAASHNLLLHNTVLDNEGDGLWLRLDPDRRAPDGATGVFNSLFAGNGWTRTEEGREISLEGESLAHARTHRLDGNRYGRHAASDWRTSTFFFVPDPEDEAGFRADDLSRWRRLTGGDARSQILDPAAIRGEGHDLGQAVDLGGAWARMGAPGAPPRVAAAPGAHGPACTSSQC